MIFEVFSEKKKMGKSDMIRVFKNVSAIHSYTKFVERLEVDRI